MTPPIGRTSAARPSSVRHPAFPGRPRGATLALAAAALAGCAGWNQLPESHSIYLEEPLWDATGAVPTADGLYVPLPAAGALALVRPDAEARRVSIGEGTVNRISVAPDERTVVAFLDRYACDVREEDQKKYDTVDECPPDHLVRTTEVGVVRNGAVASTIDIDGVYNAIEYADDGRFAVAHLDHSDPNLVLDGVLSLTTVLVIDLSDGSSTSVSVGFAAERVLFTHDGSGNAERAVVLSRNQVAVIDLTGPQPVWEATFPLTLDPDTVIEPTDVVLTPDGQYALISVDGRADLYALDLVNHSINIVELSNAPSDMDVNPLTDRTVLVYNREPVVEVLEHQFFEVESFELDEAMSRVQCGTDFALLWDGAGRNKDLYRLDLETNELVEYRLENPPVSLHVAPTEEFAILLTRAEDGFNGDGVEGIYDAHAGMEIVDLDDDDSTPYLLEGAGLGIAFSATDANLHVIVLQEGIDYLFQLDLYTREDSKIELDEPARAIGSMPDGTFYITHDTALGLVSFYDPISGRIRTSSGFAALGLFDPVELTSDAKGGK